MGPLEEDVERLKVENLALWTELREAHALIGKLQHDMESLAKKMIELQKKLEEQGSQDKRELPSFVKPDRPKGRRRRRCGPLEGHPGASRPLPEDVDEEDEIVLESCPRCGTILPDPFDYTEHVVEDIVPAHVVTRRHWCPTCKDKIQAPVPDAFSKDRFEINLTILVSYYRILGLTVGKIRALLKEQYGLDICDATILRMERQVAKEMGNHYDKLVKAVREGRAVNIDETGWRVDGRNQWLWTCATKNATIFHVNRRRSERWPTASSGGRGREE